MASAMKKMAVYLGLVDEGAPRDDYYDADYEADYDGYAEPAMEPERTRPTHVAAVPNTPMPTSAAPERRPAPAPAATPADNYRITTLHPRSYNDAKTLGLEFREGTPVIMDLTDMDDSDAKRLVDFAAGLVFGQRGTIERITNKVFLLSPANVDVSMEARNRIAEGGFFNQS